MQLLDKFYHVSPNPSMETKIRPVVNDVVSLVKDHSYLSLGNVEYSIDIFELPKA